MKAAISDYQTGNTELLFSLKDSPDRIKTLPLPESLHHGSERKR
jgi:hypothetical protein